MQFENYEQFWLFYVSQHRNATSRRLHVTGTSLALLCIALAIFVSPWWLLAPVPTGYAFAWIGHFCFEGNKPATFGHPLWSLRGDFRMYMCMLTGRMAAELAKSETIYPPKK
jgi:hypothetical protein